MSDDLFDLMKMRRKALMSVFRELDAPEVREMDGEFRATLLDQGAWMHNFITIVAFNMPGVWISKSFYPINETDGRGYNSFRVGANIKKTYHMRTYVGPSRLDGRPSYHLDYSTVNKSNVPSFTKLAGEVRKYEDALYLGIGTADFGFSRLRREKPFVLEGSRAKFDASTFGRREFIRGQRTAVAV